MAFKLSFKIVKIIFRSDIDLCKFNLLFFAEVVKLVDTPDLGSGAERCGGSSPPSRTKYQWLNPENRAYNCVQIAYKIRSKLRILLEGCLTSEELVGVTWSGPQVKDSFSYELRCIFSAHSVPPFLIENTP